jgi:hypothetical protein
MNLKNVLTAGLIAAAGLLSLTTNEANAAYPTCKSGSIVQSPDAGMGAVGAGYIAPSGAFYANNRYVALTCDSGQIINDTSGWTGSARTFVISSASVYDPDGKYATVLTALALGKKVSFSAGSFETTSPDDGACLIYSSGVCTKGNRIIMSFGMLP